MMLLAKPAQRATSIQAAAPKIEFKNYFSTLTVLAGSLPDEITSPRWTTAQRTHPDLARPGPARCDVAPCGAEGTTNAGLCQPQGTEQADVKPKLPTSRAEETKNAMKQTNAPALKRTKRKRQENGT